VLVEREFLSSLPFCHLAALAWKRAATAHQWARELNKVGHDTRLMPPTYVKAYVKRGKNDAADAAAICEAVTRPSMRFVPIQSPACLLSSCRKHRLRSERRLMNQPGVSLPSAHRYR